MDTAVALFIFNRPETTRSVFEAVKRAKPSRLYIIADGPRRDAKGESARCEEVRSVVEDIDWPCRVRRDFAEKNMGCKDRIASGLEWVFDQEEEAIILEDDCVPHPDFFPYCTELLARYRDDRRVMMITGTNFLQKDVDDDRASYFFSRHFSVWGWASWRRAWRGYDKALGSWRAGVDQKKLSEIFCNRLMARYMAQTLDRVKDGDINTWDYQWTYHCLVSGGLAVTPSVNLIKNVGVDGVHTRARTRVHNRQHGALGLELKAPRFVLANREYERHVWRVLDKLSVPRVVAGSAAAYIRRTRYLSWSYPMLRRIFRATGL